MNNIHENLVFFELSRVIFYDFFRTEISKAALGRLAIHSTPLE